jgi:hypothetical protein
MPLTPSKASVINHTIIIGPKIEPTRPVPTCCTEKSKARTATVIGTTYGSNEGVATLSPSTALSTEMDGVIIPSP